MSQKEKRDRGAAAVARNRNYNGTVSPESDSYMINYRKIALQKQSEMRKSLERKLRQLARLVDESTQESKEKKLMEQARHDGAVNDINTGLKSSGSGV